MGMIRSGDEHLHYSDSSHRWSCPYQDMDQELWRERVQAHVNDHHDTPDTPDHLIGAVRFHHADPSSAPITGEGRLNVTDRGYDGIMNEVFEPPANAPDQVDDQVSDVLNEDEVVHVPAAVEQLVESQEMNSTYPPEVPNWEPGEPPEAADR